MRSAYLIPLSVLILLDLWRISEWKDARMGVSVCAFVHTWGCMHVLYLCFCVRLCLCMYMSYVLHQGIPLHRPVPLDWCWHVPCKSHVSGDSRRLCTSVWRYINHCSCHLRHHHHHHHSHRHRRRHNKSLWLDIQRYINVNHQIIKIEIKWTKRVMEYNNNNNNNNNNYYYYNYNNSNNININNINNSNTNNNIFQNSTK